MSIEQWLKDATAQLGKAGIATARLDALLLLEDAMAKDRAWLLAHPETIVSKENCTLLTQQLRRRAMHEPIAYIRGFSDFYGRRFTVSNKVLQPRPESEAIIEQLMSLPITNGMTLADVGTGSGALGITAKLVRPGLSVTLIDIDTEALLVAKINSEKHKTELTLVHNNLLAGLQPFDIILANLPYVPIDYALNEAARHEPSIAIFGGADGLDLYRTMFKQLELSPAKYIITEALPFQQNTLATIAQAANYRSLGGDDFVQTFTR